MLKLIVILSLVSFVSANNFTIQSEFLCRNPYVDCNGHGQCVGVNVSFPDTCLCDSGYITKDCNPGTYCCKKLPNRILIFFMAFFFGELGVPYFLAGEVGLGVGILMLFLTPLIMGCNLFCCGCGFEISDNRWIVFLQILFLLLTLTISCWWLATWIMVCAETGVFDDSKVAPW